MSILKTENLTYIYSPGTPFEKAAVKNVNLEIEKGELVGVMGHTGSGKSTLIQHFNGLLKPSSGKIYLDGKDIWEEKSNIRDVRFKVGLVFQYPEYQLFEETVFADISFGPKNMGLSGDELKNRVCEICRLVGVKEEYYDTSPFDLSGGEKRRVAIAGVMAMRPKVIIFDEPIAGLDPRGRADVLKMIEDYRAEFNATVLIISHNMEDMALIADRLLVMNDGEMIAFDSTENIFMQPELLRKSGLDIPIVARVFEKLRNMGYSVPDNIFTVERAVEYLKTRMKAGQGK